MKRKMLVELDHQSVKAAQRTMEVLESEGYPGVISSHSWMDKHFTERVYRLGGFITQYGHGAEEFVEEGHAERPVRQKYDVGYGFGMDMNGFGGTPPPRADAAERPLVYPFAPLTGRGTVERQVTGERVFDLNADGVAHYGLYPDYLADMQMQPGGDAALRYLFRSAEGYLQAWTRVWEAAQP